MDKHHQSVLTGPIIDEVRRLFRYADGTPMFGRTTLREWMKKDGKRLQTGRPTYLNEKDRKVLDKSIRDAASLNVPITPQRCDEMVCPTLCKRYLLYHRLFH